VLRRRYQLTVEKVVSDMTCRARGLTSCERALERDMLVLIDAFTNDLIRDPVLATDGHVYDRSSLLKYFAARKSEGLPIVSPQDPEQPMREELGEAPADVVAALAQLRADGELLKARQARSVTFKSLEALKVVFDVLDPLSELLAATLEGWKTPVVIVFGQETSGKSSLLERLAMMPLLPRGEDTCTRLPILLKLRHTKEAQLPVLVVRDSATGKEEVRRTVSLAGGQVDVRHEMERVLAAEQGGLTSVSTTRTIEVHVHSPAVPSIDLVDLPGLKLSAGSDAADMPEKAKALVKEQVEQHKGSAIFLVSCTASTPPSQSLGLQLVEELGLQSDTIGVVTMCDNVGKLDMKKLPDRLRQTSGDAFQLAPHGFIGTMTEPIKGEGLSNVQRLEMMATAERKWFASQPLLAPLLTDGLLTCDALVDKLSSVYTQYLRSTWAPQTLIRLNGELKRLQAKCDALGLPEAVEAPTGPALDALREAACRAAEAVLDEAMGGMADECFDSIIKPTVSKLVKPGSGTGLAAMHLAMVKSAMESQHRFVSQAKQAFAADTSTFKLQRFPAFIEAIVAKLQTQASHERGTFVWREQSTAELVHEAANKVTDWREACAAERIVIRKQMLQVEPMKAKTLEVLGVASESVLTTEEVERAVASADPAAALVALLQACAIGARTPVASGIASLADAPSAQSTDPMRGALAAAGALPPLVAMLGDGTAEERAAAAEALGKLARNDANKAAMAAAGAVEALVALVRDGNCEGKAKAAAALGNLADGEDAIKAAIVAAGATEPLVALVRDGDAEGKANAAAVLWILAFGDDAIKAIAAADAIEPLVALVRDGDAQGKADAAGALGNLAGGDDAIVSAIASAGAIEPLVALVRDGDAEGKANAAGALGNLAEGDVAIVSAIAAADAIEPLVALVRDGDAEGKAYAAGALGTLAGGDDAIVSEIAAAGAIEPLVALVRDGDAQGKLKAASALRQLAKGEDAIVSAIAAAGASDSLVALVRGGDARGKAKVPGSLVYTAAYHGNILHLKKLLQRHANELDRLLKWPHPHGGATAIYVACEFGHTDAVQLLLEAKAPPDLPREDGATPLYKACQDGKLDIVKLLMKHGAKVDQIDANQMTALWVACHQGHIELAKVLLEAKADPTFKVQEWTPIMLAKREQRNELVELLLKHAPAGYEEQRQLHGPAAAAAQPPPKPPIVDGDEEASEDGLLSLFQSHEA
jgi:vacuolar protein 8